MVYLLLVLLCMSLFLEGTITSLPLVLSCLLCLTILRRDASVFFLAILSGIILDVLALRPLGSSSLFFVIFVFLLVLYQRKYEIDSYPFVGFAAFFGSLLFLAIFGGGNIILYSLLSTIISVTVFVLTKLTFHTRKETRFL